MSLSSVRLTREGVCRAFGLSPAVLKILEAQGVLKPDADHTFDLTEAAATLVRFGLGQAAQAERKLAAVSEALRAISPALQRLSELPDRAMLDAWARERVADELAAFFTAFAALLARSSAALDGPPGEERR
jgi:predicted RNA-binding Zn ribbon-like protein